ncbi:hypothetical protein [Sandaracinus amylolyticus]|nr:hypothetical protein [Sandaracinus amylolyticus]
MRAIASDFFATSPLMAGPQIAMLIFLAIFVLVAVRIARGGARQWDAAARLPLEDEKESRHE